MSTPNRIYKVASTKVTDSQRLVRAPNIAQALRHVAADSFVTTVASQDDLVALVAKGVKVEDSAAPAAGTTEGVQS